MCHYYVNCGSISHVICPFWSGRATRGSGAGGRRTPSAKRITLATAPAAFPRGPQGTANGERVLDAFGVETTDRTGSREVGHDRRTSPATVEEIQPQWIVFDSRRPCDRCIDAWRNERASEPAGNHSPVHDCGDRLDAPDVVFRAAEIVAVDYNQVSELAGFD